MAAEECVSCGKVGTQKLNQHVASGPPPVQKQSVTYNMGHGNTTTDENVAKKALLERDFKEIADLESISQSKFQHGMIGAKFLPCIFISKIPRVVEPAAYDHQHKVKKSKIDPKEHAKNLKNIVKESSEKSTFDGLVAYFRKNTQEDVFVTFNQDIRDKTQTNPTWHELDALVINLTRGYILVIEAKGNLNNQPLKKALKQLKKTTGIFLKNLASGLKQEWKLIKMIYSADVNPSLNICSTCQPYVISPAKGDFVNQIEVILNQELIKGWSYVQDFHYLVKEILPLRVRIASQLTNIFTMNATIFENIKNNVEAAGTAEMVGFWSRDQLNIAEDCLNLPRILFDSAFSTGKTILMINCMTELLKKNKKVLFVIHDDKYLGHGKDIPPLLQSKIESHFIQLHQQGVYQDLSHFQVMEVDMSKQHNFDLLFKTHSDFHFFVDEVRFDTDLNYDQINYWSRRIPPNQHCWIAICYGKDKEKYDRSKLLGQFPMLTGMAKAMRNNEGNVKLVKEKITISSNVGYNDTSKIRELEIPSNLTRNFQTERFQLEANNYQDGFEKVFEALKHIDDACNNTSILFVIPWQHTSVLWSLPRFCKCYKERSLKELRTLISPIYNKFNRPQPNVYLEKADIDQTKRWVKNSKKTNDLITDSILVNGFEHPIVAIFNQIGYFQHNLAMRATGIIVVVDIRFIPWRKKCFLNAGQRCLRSHFF